MARKIFRRWGWLFAALDVVAIATVFVPLMYGTAASVARDEAQTAADAAALAAVAALLRMPGNVAYAKAEATVTAARNTVNGRPAELAPEAIVVDTAKGRVEVEVHGRALPFDVPILRPSVSAHAAAEGGAADARGHTFKPLRLTE